MVAIESIQEGINFQAIAPTQTTDLNVQAYHTTQPGLQLEDVFFRSKCNIIICDISTGQPMQACGASRVEKVGFDVIHTCSLSHPSTCTSTKFVWHNLNKKVGVWARASIPCQILKVQQHITAPLQSFRIPSHSFHHIHFDHVGRPPPSEGFTYHLTLVDGSLSGVRPFHSRTQQPAFVFKH